MLMADTAPVEDLLDMTAYPEQSPVLHIFVDVTEPLIWLVASLFTQDFLSKVSFFGSTTYRSYDDFYAAIEAYIQANHDAQKCLGDARKALTEGGIDQHIRLADEWGEFNEPELPVKAQSFSFYVWAEKNGYAIPQILMPVLRNLAQLHVSAKTAFEQREYQFPAITREQFLDRSKEPLWRIDKGILYLLGRRSRAGKEGDFIKTDKTAQKIRQYIFDAYKVKRIKLIFSGMDLGEEWKTAENIKAEQVEPGQLIKLAKGFPIRLPILEEELATQRQKAVPVPQYMTNEMALMMDAVGRFWSHYDLTKPDPNKAPLKKDVVKWLRKEAEKRGFEVSDNIAKVMDTIIRCPLARKGGNSL